MTRLNNSGNYDKINFKLHEQNGILAISLNMIKVEKSNTGQLVEKVVDYYVARNPKNIEAILDTLVETAKNFSINNGQLISNYRKTDRFVIDNYESLKSYPQLQEFSKKVDKALEKEKIKSSIKNLRISKKKSKLKKINKFLGVSAVAFGELGACFAAWEYGSYLADLSNSKHEMLIDDETVVVQEDKTNSVLYNNSIVQTGVPKILVKQKESSEPVLNNDTVMEKENSPVILDEQVLVEPKSNEILVSESSGKVEELANEATSNIQKVVEESQTYYKQVLNEAKDNLQDFLKQTINTDSNTVAIVPEMVSANVKDESLKEEILEPSSDISGIDVSVNPESIPVVASNGESDKQENILEEVASDMILDEEFLSLTDLFSEENADPAEIKPLEEERIVFSSDDNTDVSEGGNSIATQELTLNETKPLGTEIIKLSSPVKNDSGVINEDPIEISEQGFFLAATTDTVFKSKPYHNVTEKEKLKIAAVVAGEDSYTYEGSLAVMSTVLNRCDTKEFSHYGGQDPYKQLFHPSQFVAKDASIAKRYYEHPEEIPDFVMAAVEDALNGYRNHEYTSFRSKKSEGRVRIGENGNWYFQKSNSIPNFGLIDIEKKVR